MSEIIKVRVINFDDYNAKSKGKVMPWFRLQTRLARSSKYLQLSPGAKLMWLWVLCECAQSSSRVAWVCPRGVSKEVHVKPHNVPKVIRELTDLEWIQVLGSEKQLYDTNETNERTRRDETDIRENSRTASDPSPPKVLKTQKIHWLGEIWNEHRGTLAEVRKTDRMLKNISKRIAEEPSPEFWVRVVKRIAASDFCTGKNDRGFVASFTWMISTGKDQILNYVKVDNGNYDNRVGHTAPAKHDFTTEARKVLAAVGRFGPGDLGINEFLGEELLSDVKHAMGSIRRVREMPDNEFTIREIASALKAAAANKNKPTLGGTHE